MSKPNKTLKIIGVDVSKKKLDIALDENHVVTLDNSQEAFTQFLKSLDEPHETLSFIMEATGGYEKAFKEFLLKHSIKIAVVNPKRVRDFAKSMGQLAKNDTIDAKIIREYARAGNILYAKPETPKERQINALVKRRQQLLKHLTVEKNYRENSNERVVIRSIDSMIKLLEKRLGAVDKQILEYMNEDQNYNRNKTLITGIKCVSEKTATTLLIRLPELGVLNNKQIAALVGVAPFCNDSGQHKGKRLIWGGRKEVRTALYMPMLSAIQYNPVIRAFYQRLIKRGKSGKVALIACMRKLLTIINSMIKNQTPWNDNYASLS